MYQGIELNSQALIGSEQELTSHEDLAVLNRLGMLVDETSNPKGVLADIAVILGYYFQGMFPGSGFKDVDELYFKLVGVNPEWNNLPNDILLQQANQRMNEMFIWHDLLTIEETIGHTSIGSLQPSIFNTLDELESNGITNLKEKLCWVELIKL